jgi:hypothetical protein
MKRQKWFRLILTAFFICGLPSCIGTVTPKTLGAGEVILLADRCEVVYTAQLEAWNSRNPDQLRLVYTDDIVHFDGEPKFVGIDEVTAMAKKIYKNFPDWQMESGETYISKDLCLGTWINWGLFGFTQESPGIEFDLLETREHKISFWRLFYDQNFWQAWGIKNKVEHDLLSEFAASWSGGKLRPLMRLYAADIRLEDTLFGISVTGQRALKNYAEGFFANYPEASWELLYPFAESKATSSLKEHYPYASQGGVFAISVKDSDGDPCEIRTVVILTPDEEGKIQSQQIFYEADTLLACDWAE